MSKKPKIKFDSPGHVRLRRYRVTPQHLERLQDFAQNYLYVMVSEIEKLTEKNALEMENIYSRGFEDGFAAALLESEANK